MNINLDSWNLLTYQKTLYFKKIKFSDLIDSSNTFKPGNITKEITELEEDLISLDSSEKGGFANIFFYSYKGKNYALKVDKVNGSEIESDIYFYIFNLQRLINEFLRDSEYNLQFIPPILKCLYFILYNKPLKKIKHYTFIINEKMNDCLQEIKLKKDISFLKSMIYIISCKILYLQSNIGFNHNDLKLENIVWFLNNGVIDFNFIDLGFTRIKPDGYTQIFSRQYGVTDKTITGKDLYTLVHHILYYLKLNELEDLFNEFTDFMELLNLEINLDFIEPRSFNKMSEDIKEYYDEKYSYAEELPQNSIPFFFSYTKPTYPSSYNPISIIQKIQKLQSTTRLINDLTFDLGKKYLSLLENFFVDKPRKKRKYLIKYI